MTRSQPRLAGGARGIRGDSSKTYSGRTCQSAHKPRQDAATCAFFVLRRLEQCWCNSAIKEIVFAEMQDSDNSPWQFQALLEPLLEAGFDPARELAIATLAETGPERRGFVLAAAFDIVRFSAIHVWPKIWTLVLNERTSEGSCSSNWLNTGDFRPRFMSACLNRPWGTGSLVGAEVSS